MSEHKPILIADLRELRKLETFTLQRVAKECGVSVSALSRIEQGIAPSMLAAIRISEFYGVPIGAIWADPLTLICEQCEEFSAALEYAKDNVPLCPTCMKTLVDARTEGSKP